MSFDCIICVMSLLLLQLEIDEYVLRGKLFQELINGKEMETGYLSMLHWAKLKLLSMGIVEKYTPSNTKWCKD
jgi:hypothetical protein